jgi:peptide/nickel transport system permease protein
MISLALQRLVGVLLSLWVVITLVFFTLHLLPGDPVEAALAQSTAPFEVIEQRRAVLGLDRPLLAQYASYIASLIRGRWGISWSNGQQVEVLVVSQLPPTLALASSSMVVAVVLGSLYGYGSAVAKSPVIRAICDGTTAVAVGMPVMVSGILLIWVFSLQLDWLPATGQSGFASLILPSVAVGFTTSGGTARSVSSALRAVLREPYILAARAKGLSFHEAILRHGARAALPTVISVITLQFGYLAAGTIVAEGVFARQGVGRLLLYSVLNQDLPIVQAIVVLTALTYLILNLLADLLHVALDPRLRTL